MAMASSPSSLRCAAGSRTCTRTAGRTATSSPRTCSSRRPAGSCATLAPSGTHPSATSTASRVRRSCLKPRSGSTAPRRRSTARPRCTTSELASPSSRRLTCGPSECCCTRCCSGAASSARRARSGWAVSALSRRSSCPTRRSARSHPSEGRERRSSRCCAPLSPAAQRRGRRRRRCWRGAAARASRSRGEGAAPPRSPLSRRDASLRAAESGGQSTSSLRPARAAAARAGWSARTRSARTRRRCGRYTRGHAPTSPSRRTACRASSSPFGAAAAGRRTPSWGGRRCRSSRTRLAAPSGPRRGGRCRRGAAARSCAWRSRGRTARSPPRRLRASRPARRRRRPQTSRRRRRRSHRGPLSERAPRAPSLVCGTRLSFSLHGREIMDAAADVRSARRPQRVLRP
mmetsp:Transcript_41811/g.128938  ORF Transcript_41811/g.128938 Transcript_41811/m.128938 type:complete len:402 (-) Transcript_41811:60-1265(-)